MLTHIMMQILLRKNLVVLALTLGVSLLLASCNGPTSSSDPTQISFSVFGSAEEYQAYQDIVAAFKEKHPEIEVQLEYVPEDDEYRQRLATQFSGGQPPDVMLLDYRHFAPFAADNVLETVGPYLDKSSLIQASDFYQQPLNAFTYEGTL